MRAFIVALALTAGAFASVANAETKFSDIAGWWSADPVYAGESSRVVLHLLEHEGKPTARLSIVAIGGYEFPLGTVTISGDSLDSHHRFIEKHRLPFLLASDERGALRRAFGVPRMLGILPGRATYVIDREGRIRHRFSAQFAAKKHVRTALEAVQSLSAPAAG